MVRGSRFGLAAAAYTALAALIAASEGPAGLGPENFERAARYSESSNGLSLLVMKDGDVVYEHYAPVLARLGGPDMPLELASGTKSFSGVLAAFAAADGLVSFDERVSDTIVEWLEDPARREMTIAQLLSLTGGLRTGGERGEVPSYAEAVAAPQASQPGREFRYGAVPFQVFGELMRRKLGGKDPVDYLKEKLFSKIGLEHGRWMKDRDGNSHLPSGAALSARNWALFGEFVRLGGTWEGERLLPREILDRCFGGTQANPAYGLSWWLNREVPPAIRDTIVQLENGADYMFDADFIPKDLIFAAGAGKQRLYVMRSLGLVVVRQGGRIRGSLSGAYRPEFSDLEFLALLLGERR